MVSTVHGEAVRDVALGSFIAKLVRGGDPNDWVSGLVKKMKWILIMVVALFALACNLTPRPHPGDPFDPAASKTTGFDDGVVTTVPTVNGATNGVGDFNATPNTETQGDASAPDARCDEDDEPDTCVVTEEEPCENDLQ